MTTLKAEMPLRHLSRRAFTVVELLVAIGIIAVLGMLLLAGLQKITVKTQLVQCSTSLRALYSTLNAYAMDQNGRLPPAMAAGNGETYWRKSLLVYWNLPKSVESMSKTPLLCPAVKSSLRNDHVAENFIPYALNYYLSAVRITAIRKPAHTFLATDAPVKPGSLPNECASLTTITNYGRNFHGGGQNILYADGHIEYFHDIRRIAREPFSLGASEDIWSP